MTLKTKNTTQTTNSTPRAMSVRQPVGTNHFQFRDHQFPRGACLGNGGGWDGELDSMKSFCLSTKSKSSNLLRFGHSTFSANRRENQNQIRILPDTPSSKKQ